MQLFEDLVKCKDCMNNINSKCILYPGKDVKEENTGCYVGIDRNNKQKIVGGVLSEKNSIEEDIKIIEDFILKTDVDYSEYNEQIVGDISYQAIQHLLSAYKRALKENEELKNEVMEKDLEIIGKEEYTKDSMKEIIEQYYTAKEECIPKQRIKDIIDRIDYDIKKTKEIISNGRKNDYQIVRLRAMNTKSLDIKKRLQELLKKED